MRLLLVLALLLAPQTLLAQFNAFQPGSYVLASNPAQRLTGELKLRGCTELLVKNHAGKNLKFDVAEVASFRLGQQQYIRAGGFPVDAGLEGDTIDQAFVEQVDSGQVTLMRLSYIVNGAPMVGPGGLPTGTTRSYEVYLLRRANEATITPLPANSLTGGGKKFREALLPYLVGHPDLIKLVNDKLITTENLPKLIHALNAGAPTQ